MAPGNNERHPGHTGTIPKTKARNNCNVPQEAVTPTRRDMATNMASTSLDWVPVSEYNSRGNYNQSRKQTNNSSDQELTDLDNSVSFESGFGRFVPVRPQPRALPLNVQNQNLTADTHDDGAGSTASGHSLHPYAQQTYAQQMQNGLMPHSNHAAAAVMIVNPTTPNAVAGNMSQPFNAPNQNRNNLTRNLNPARNNFEGNSHPSNNNTTPPISNSRTAAKSVNIMNNMYDQGQGSFNNLNDNNQVHRESARALGEAIVAACPDAAAVERRLGQIREYIRVTSSLVDTMRNSEDEAYIEHTKEEYDELVQMVMKLKESEAKLEGILEKGPDNIEVPAEETEEAIALTEPALPEQEGLVDKNVNHDKASNNVKNHNDASAVNNNLKKVTNIENEQLNKNLHSVKADDVHTQTQHENEPSEVASTPEQPQINTENREALTSEVEIKEIETIPYTEEVDKDEHLNQALRKNILSCVEKVARIEEMKKKCTRSAEDQQDVVVRPISVQSNGSAYSENELWQNEIKNKMEMSQVRLTALKKQQKRLLQYQQEAKQQLDEMNRERQSQEINPSTSHDNFSNMSGQSYSGNYNNPNRMYTANQIGVATTLPHSAESMHGQQNMAASIENDHAHSTHSQDDRFSHREANIASSEEAAGGGRDSELEEEDEGILSERARLLQMKLRELQLKKQHMESLVTEFQKLQMVTRVGSSRNTYSSSGEDSGVEESSRKFADNKSGGNIKNEDPFKLMEIKAIKAALQKTKDLMRSVENYEDEHLSHVPDESFQVPNHSNINDNKSEGGGSMDRWSTEGSVCRVRNSLPQRHKFTNEQHHHPQQQQNQQQHNHEASIAALQELAQELRMETEKIMGERARIKDCLTNKEVGRKQKKVNEEVRASPAGGVPAPLPPPPGPAERRQMQLRALLADKQRELEALLNKEKVLCTGPEAQNQKTDSRSASVVNQSYTSEQEEPDSRSEQILMDSQDSRENENFRGGGDSALGARSMNTVPSHLGSAYGSDSDSASRNKSNQRNRARRRHPQDRQADDINVCNTPQQNNTNHNIRHDTRPEPSNVNLVPPISQNENPSNGPYSHGPPPCWNSSKSNQDMRNQFTQNSHSQTMERLLGTPQMSFPPSLPFNMMMPYGMGGLGMASCGCGCGFWGAWCCQQVLLQQREIHQLREQLAHMEERWRAETASHTLNNQVPPGNRANNYWDNFRSYSRQNLLSANSKTNADGHLVAGPPPPHPHPLVARSHNTLHRAPAATSPKRNTNPHPAPPPPPPPPPAARRNAAYERSLSFSSAPDVLNLNHTDEHPDPSPDLADAHPPPLNINRHENPFRNLNITNPIPEIIQSHSNNLNSSANLKKKSSSKLPAKNSRRNNATALDYSQTSNINIASTSETPNPNLASTSREVQEKATSKLFDLLRENVYTEVTTLIGVNESHPDFLIQLFRELQLISSDPLRQRVLQSIRNVLSQYATAMGSQEEEVLEESRAEPVSSSDEPADYRECGAAPNACSTTVHIDNKIIRFLLIKSEDVCTTEFLEALASLILSTGDNRRSPQTKKRLVDILSKYEGMLVREVSGDILENLPMITSENTEADESTQLTSELSEASILQDVAGSLNLFSSSDTQLHQMNACPYDMWPGHVHMEIDGPEEGSPRSSHDGKVDLINCSEMQNGDLAEADQTCRAQGAGAGAGAGPAGAGGDAGGADALPDVVDTDEATPTEAEAEWLGLDRVPTRLHMEESSEKQKD